jgi:superfamily II DNA or RNA helicase
MVSIKDLIFHIPEGKKRNYLGSLYVNSITDFYNNFEQNFVDLDELVERNIDLVIEKDDFLRDLKLFCNDQVNDILIEIGVRNLAGLNDLRSHLISYFKIEISDDSRLTFNVDNSSNCEIPLHPFQERIRRKVINLIFNNQKKFLIHMPTGSGKTRTAAEVILDFVRLSSSKALLSDKIKILWVAQSSELCLQASETVKYILDKKATQSIKIGHFYDDLNINDDIINESAIIFCSIQKLLLHYQTDGIWAKIKNETYLVIVDEAHRSVASKWVNALNFFVENRSVYLLGLTATPGISSSVNENNYLLSTFYNGNKVSITDSNYVEVTSPISYLVDRGFLSAIDRIDIDSDIQINSTGYSITAEEIKFTDVTLKKLTANPSRNLSIINIIKDNYLKGKKILVFTCGVEHNRVLNSILLDFDIESAFIDAKSKNRRQIIDKFKNGNLNVLLNFGVLTTGFDAPKTDVCIIARPISSIIMYSQMVGRILRGPLNQGNKNNTLYTIKDNLGHGDYDQLFQSFNEFYI